MGAGGSFCGAMVTKHRGLFSMDVLMEKIHSVQDGPAFGGVGTVIELVVAKLAGKVSHWAFRPTIV